MKKIQIIYWSMTGNTKAMAEAPDAGGLQACRAYGKKIAEAAKERG